MSQKIVPRNETPLQSFNFFKRIFSRIFFISSALICCFCMFLFRFLAFARNNLSKIFQSLLLFYYDMWVAVDFNIQMSILSSIIHESLRRCVQFNVINRVNAPISFNISSNKRHSKFAKKNLPLRASYLLMYQSIIGWGSHVVSNPSCC